MQDDDDREDSTDWRPQTDPTIAALYEQPIGDKEEAPWEQERLRLQRAVILGAPGGGKTFLTQTTALAMAKQGLEEWKKRSTPLDQLPLPIRADLNDLASESGSDDLFDILPSLVSSTYKLPALEPWLRRNLKADNCWVIFDALDQVDSDYMVGLTRRLESIRDWKCHALITCRKANYDRTNIPWTTITEYELAPFDATEIAAFITRWHAGKDGRGEKLNEVVGRSYSLQQACGTPLMLTLACLAHEEEALTEETRRVDLYWMVLRGILRNAWREPRLGPKDPRIDDLLRMLRPMAWKLFVVSPSVNQFASSRVVEAIEVGASSARLTDAVLAVRDELVERGVRVDAGMVRGEGQFSFLHRSFQEFLVAEYLGREVDGRGWEAIRPLLDKKSWAPEWQEVIVLLAGILKDPAPLLEMLRVPEKDDIFRHRLALAAQCMGELSTRVECKALINDVTAQAWECYWSHAIQSTEKAAEGIVHALPALAKVDGAIRSHLRLLAHTSGLLLNPDKNVRSDAARALGRMGPTAAHTDVVDRLVACLRDPVRDVRYGATDALGAMAPTSARANVVDRLLELLRHSEGILGYHAAVALGRMGPAVHAVVVGHLFEYLLDPDANVRASAALALGRMGARSGTRGGGGPAGRLPVGSSRGSASQGCGCAREDRAGGTRTGCGPVAGASAESKAKCGRRGDRGAGEYGAVGGRGCGGPAGGVPAGSGQGDAIRCRDSVEKDWADGGAGGRCGPAGGVCAGSRRPGCASMPQRPWGGWGQRRRAQTWWISSWKGCGTRMSGCSTRPPKR